MFRLRFLRITILVLTLFSAGSVPVHAAVIILTSDRQLNDLMDPDRKIDMSLGHEKRFASLREVCEEAMKNRETTLTVAFDEFFRQYREQAGTERLLTPDMDEYIGKIKKISDFAARYDLGIELSLLSPLELGQAFTKSTGESGRWLEYKVGYRDPSTGQFSVAMWQQLYWTNNKGRFSIRMKGVRAYAFRESAVPGAPLRAVDPSDIAEVEGVRFEALDTVSVRGSGLLVPASGEKPGQAAYFKCRNLRVFHPGSDRLKGYDRVLVIVEYETPEMDYFSPAAPGFLKDLMRKYHDRGVNLVSLYSDEMHIQQDWHYFTHHGNGQFSIRYLTKNFSDGYYRRFGQRLDDRDLLYFVSGATSYGASAMDSRNMQYVMGKAPSDIHRTYLLRDRYYRMLNEGVVDLFKDAKTFAEDLFGRKLAATGHSSWAESPTIDLWDTELKNEYAAKYEYTSNYVWGNTVHQAAAACYDYFKWGEYLEPTGNDFAECGWLDRDYYGAAMAASIGVVNRYPQAYAAAWGMPEESRLWKDALNTAFGGRNGSVANVISGGVHRDIEVLILYPMDLVAVDERFGSWMTQYAYANYLPSEKLLGMGRITDDGFVETAGKKYNTIVAVFEPLPPAGLLKFLGDFASAGGRVIWFGPPPLLNSDGENCTAEWSKLFGVSYEHKTCLGEIAAGRMVNFSNRMAAIPPQTILTDFPVDRIYPVTQAGRGEVVARSGDKILGTVTGHGKGTAAFMGFRPRDDQSASLGYETRTLFEILAVSGSYPGSDNSISENDNPSFISRTTPYFVTRFPNGSTFVVKHYRTHAESWEGGFSRNTHRDEKDLALNPLPSDSIDLNAFRVNSHSLIYKGRRSLLFRTDAGGRLNGFEGHQCTGINIDGFNYKFSEKPFGSLSFCSYPDDQTLCTVSATGTGWLTIPVPPGHSHGIKVTAPGIRRIESSFSDGEARILITPELSGKAMSIRISGK